MTLECRALTIRIQITMSHFMRDNYNKRPVMVTKNAIPTQQQQQQRHNDMKDTTHLFDFPIEFMRSPHTCIFCAFMAVLLAHCHCRLYCY